MDRPSDPAGRATYLVERYWPGVDVDALRAAIPRLEAAAREMTDAGTRVEHVGSILMPVDRIATAIALLGDRPAQEKRTDR